MSNSQSNAAMAHHQFGASSAHRWMACALSVVMDRELPAVASRYATIGEAEHLAAAAALTEDEDNAPATEASVAGYVEFCREAARRMDGHLLVEHRVQFGPAIGEPGAFGTADCVIVSGDLSTVAVIDKKFQWGHSVPAESNPQLMLYALGAREKIVNEHGVAPSLYKFAIYQTEKSIGEELFDWECDDAMLLSFARSAEAKVRRASRCVSDFSKGYPLNVLASTYAEPSEETCRYCRGKAECPAIAKSVAAALPVAKDVSGTLEAAIASVGELADMTRLGELRAIAPLVKQWAEAVIARVEQELRSGNAIPGWKLVAGRNPPKRWIDSETASEVLMSLPEIGEKAFEKKLISPAKAARLLKEQKASADVLEELVSRGEAKSVVAPDTDPRPEISTAPVFDNLLLEDSSHEISD